MKDYLKTLIDPIIREKFDSKKLLLQLITRKIEAVGITLTDEQKQSIETELQQNVTSSFKLDPSDDQLKASKVDLGTEKILALKFEENELPDIEKLSRQTVNVIISACRTEVADILVSAWEAQASETLEAERTDLQSFNNEIISVWGKAIDLLQMLLGITNANFSQFNDELRCNMPKGKSHTIEAITRLHARG